MNFFSTGVRSWFLRTRNHLSICLVVRSVCLESDCKGKHWYKIEVSYIYAFLFFQCKEMSIEMRIIYNTNTTWHLHYLTKHKLTELAVDSWNAYFLPTWYLKISESMLEFILLPPSLISTAILHISIFKELHKSNFISFILSPCILGFIVDLITSCVGSTITNRSS